MFADIIGDTGSLADTTNASETNGDNRTAQEDSVLVPVPGAQLGHLPIQTIIPNRRQPREIFDEDELEELAESIAEVGVLQPIVVRALDVDEPDYSALVAKRQQQGIEVPPLFELIMGERRLRASLRAGREIIPAIIKDTKDDDLLRDALLENLHRTQLNPLEEAAAYQQLMEDFGCTQQELSERIARSRSQIANTIRLLKLPGNVQRKLAAGVISAGHARALLALPTTQKMAVLADRIVAEGLSVRSTEEIVSLGDVSETSGRESNSQSARIVRPTSPEAMELIDHLEDLLDTRVTVQEGKTKGRIVIEFAGHDDLARLMLVVKELRRD